MNTKQPHFNKLSTYHHVSTLRVSTLRHQVLGRASLSPFRDVVAPRHELIESTESTRCHCGGALELCVQVSGERDGVSRCSDCSRITLIDGCVPPGNQTPGINEIVWTLSLYHYSPNEYMS